ncbi:MAG: hypothetical protein JO121_03265 [Deltaproteobacteria bacterium]|jgi:uncharacterized membrane protein|nr:hypothetical protein [Deltaproteobacteria bacterium]
MSKTRLAGAVLATAVAVLFAGTIANAAGDSSGAPQIKCQGGNSCKGQSACKSASSSCQGQNSCKGKGWVMTASIKECQADGGKPEQPSTK